MNKELKTGLIAALENQPSANFSAEDLELDLLKIYKRVNDEVNTTSVRGIGRAFTVYAPETNKDTENPLDAFVRKNLKR